MLLHIVRHGEPDYVTDTLTDRGRLQAETVAKRLYASGINKIYSSPLGRARQTAEPTCRLLGLECNVEEWAREITDELLTPFPDGELKSITKIQNTYYREKGNINLPYEKAFDCQGLNQSNMRSAVDFIEKNGNTFLEKLGYREENGIYRILRNNEERVALFCHSAFSKAWISILLHIPLHIMWSSFSFAHTGVTIINFKNNENGVTAPR